MPKEQLIIAVLAAMLAVAALKWFRYWAGCRVLMAWIMENRLPLPPEEDLKRIVKWVVKNIFKP